MACHIIPYESNPVMHVFTPKYKNIKYPESSQQTTRLLDRRRCGRARGRNSAITILLLQFVRNRFRTSGARSSPTSSPRLCLSAVRPLMLNNPRGTHTSINSPQTHIHTRPLYRNISINIASDRGGGIPAECIRAPLCGVGGVTMSGKGESSALATRRNIIH